MNTQANSQPTSDPERVAPPADRDDASHAYERCIEVSQRVRWDIDADVIRGREFDFDERFLPGGLSFVDRLDFLDDREQRMLGQVQGRTYANMFGLVERFITAKILEVSRDHWLGDQTKLEALVRFSDEELKHQALFRRIEGMIAGGMAPGYVFAPSPDEVASVVLGRSTWAVLGLTCLIELFTQAHYEQSIEPEHGLSDLFKDVFLYHWKEESQHARLDELEWQREDARLGPCARDSAVDDLVALVGAVDGLLQAQAGADASYFVRTSTRSFTQEQVDAIGRTVLEAYRWQYIGSGVEHPRFLAVLGSLTSPAQRARIAEALAAIC